jgi:uncharacterized protein YjbJ (UPF0337 family)
MVPRRAADRRRTAVAGSDKARNKTEKVKGKAKQILGRVFKDPTLQTKGRDQQRARPI